MEQKIRALPLASPSTIPSQHNRTARFASQNRKLRGRLVLIHRCPQKKRHIPTSQRHSRHHRHRARYRKKETKDKSHRWRTHMEPHHPRIVPSFPQRPHGHRLLRYPHPPHGRTTTTGNTILSPYRTCPHTASLRGSTAERMGLCHQKQPSLHSPTYRQHRLRGTTVQTPVTRCSGMVLTLRPLHATSQNKAARHTARSAVVDRRRHERAFHRLAYSHSRLQHRSQRLRTLPRPQSRSLGHGTQLRLRSALRQNRALGIGVQHRLRLCRVQLRRIP